MRIINFAFVFGIIVLISINSVMAANERCGKDYGSCLPGYCCSRHNYCGLSDAHCLSSQGCQSKYGKCSGNVPGDDSDDDKPISLKGKGRMTYYGDGGDCPSNIALPACGFVDFNTKYYVAMNFHQYDSTLINSSNPNDAKVCNTCIKITYDNKSVIGKVIDKCPVCPEGAIDVSRTIFKKFADLDVGVIDVSWETVSCDGLILTSGDPCEV